MQIAIIIFLSFLSAILYRLGGMGDSGRQQFPKMPKWLFNTKARDVGCALCCAVGMIFLSVQWYWILLSFLFLFGALTTYWDFLFGYDNFWVHGFMCGLAAFPLGIGGVEWYLIVIRCIAVSVLMGGISALSKNDYVEECGRGFSLPITMFILLIK